MADFTINLPSWARWLGYTAEGDRGTYGGLILLKNGKVVRTWYYHEIQPNIFEIEDFLMELEEVK